MAAARAPSRLASTLAVAAPRLATTRTAAPALPLPRAPAAPRSGAGLLASVRLQRALCVAARAQAAEAAAAAEQQQQGPATAAAAPHEQQQQQEEGPKKEYVVVNFFHLVDLERPWEVRCQPGLAMAALAGCRLRSVPCGEAPAGSHLRLR